VEFSKVKVWQAQDDKLALINSLKPCANVTVIAAIDCHSLVHYEIVDGTFDRDRFLSFLRNMRAKLRRNDRVALFHDGHSVHKTRTVQDALMREFGWLPILNVAYEPNANPIEGYFGVLKRHYRREVLKLQSV
jgi:transposase